VHLLFEGGPWADRLLDTEVTTAPDFVAPDDDNPGAYRRVELRPGAALVVYEWLPDWTESTTRSPQRRKREVTPRFAVEMFGAVAAVALAIVTIFWQAWIEPVFGVSPDQGDGAVEWAAVFTLTAISISLLFAAKRECRRLSIARAP
jgi:hypothetical protein